MSFADPGGRCAQRSSFRLRLLPSGRRREVGRVLGARPSGVQGDIFGGGGIMPGQHFSIVAQRMKLRPHELHLITFYPTLGIR